MPTYGHRNRPARLPRAAILPPTAVERLRLIAGALAIVAGIVAYIVAMVVAANIVQN